MLSPKDVPLFSKQIKSCSCACINLGGFPIVTQQIKTLDISQDECIDYVNLLKQTCSESYGKFVLVTLLPPESTLVSWQYFLEEVGIQSFSEIGLEIVVSDYFSMKDLEIEETQVSSLSKVLYRRRSLEDAIDAAVNYMGIVFV